MKIIPIMQCDGPQQSYFVLQHEETREVAKDVVYRMVQKRNAKKQVFPKWRIDGITY